MVRIDENGSFMRLYDAVTNSQCVTCDQHLEWKPGFDSVFDHPKYSSHHCGHEHDHDRHCKGKDG